jgi:hypothetical protein
MNFDDYQRPHWIAELTAQAACQANEVQRRRKHVRRGGAYPRQREWLLPNRWYLQRTHRC